MMNEVTITKEYADIPFAHRQPKHDGHCAWIHGHNWTFRLTFAADVLDKCGFVVDFGKLKFIREWLNQFDHALVLNEDDPMLGNLRDALEVFPMTRLAQIIPVPDCSSEGLARYVLTSVNTLLATHADDFDCRGVRCVAVQVVEDAKNSATWRYTPPPR